MINVFLGLSIWIVFPFFISQKAKKMKQENTPEARRKFNLFLLCTLPVPIISFALLILGIRNLL